MSITFTPSPQGHSKGRPPISRRGIRHYHKDYPLEINPICVPGPNLIYLTSLQRLYCFLELDETNDADIDHLRTTFIARGSLSSVKGPCPDHVYVRKDWALEKSTYLSTDFDALDWYQHSGRHYSI